MSWRRLGVATLLVLAALVWRERLALQAFPKIISAYSAKEYCSCRYVMNFPASYCHGYVEQYVPLNDFVDDSTQRLVTARGLGQSNSASWLGPHQGCRLLP